MTKEEAIKELENMKKFNYTLAPLEVFDMAIKALWAVEHMPTTKNDLGVDCISRADALSDKGLGEFHFYEDYAKMRNYLKSLPSVIPQEPTDKNFTKADIDAIVKAINKGWELRVNEILSKIRAQILEEHENAYAREDDDTAYGLSMALDILDKYKAESEEV